jgi:hypothetical protein
MSEHGQEIALYAAALKAAEDRAEAAEAALADARDKALEEAALIADDYGRDGNLTKAYECETADELAARIRALKSA